MLNCTPIEYCMGNISELSDSELLQVATAIKREQNARENKKKQELINKAVAALNDLQAEYFGCITITCDDCGNEMCLTPNEIAEKIKYDLE